MKKLDPNWLTEGYIDFEYKQYILLDYLQKVSRSFKRKSLYPVLSDLVFHYNNLLRLKENKNFLSSQVPKKLDRIDLKKLKLVYEEVDLDDNNMKELEKLVEFSIPRVENEIRNGKELFDWVEDNIEVDPIGLRPLYDKEGYLFLTYDGLAEVMIYQYKMSSIKNDKDKFFALHTQLVKTEEKSVANHYHQIKLNLLASNKELPNPATFLVVAKRRLPFKATLLPVAERLLMRTLNNAA
ncbi:hypothetical protein [Luteibaculum oceani]|uniref:Uncharacterized protein n=1 Tax=Luteibaculum oceani TaxID=1294296 RepID=A0A5C6V9I4_9FLAO|nr:hypothetical protein [Luteibaculum oceani]TXC82153.1 hypothetical protein FRX97_03400 [Luteibaculum oceani]